MSSRPNNRTIATILSALLLPLSLLAGVATSAILKSTNPDNVDITNGLAYLQQTMAAALIVGILIGCAVVLLVVRMYRQDRNFSQAKLPLVLLIAVVVCIGAVALLTNYSSALEDQYRIDHGQPTLQQFFDTLDKNKK